MLVLPLVALATAQTLDLTPHFNIEPAREIKFPLALAGEEVVVGMAFPPDTCVDVDVLVVGPLGVVDTGFWFDVGEGPNYWAGGQVDVLRPLTGEHVYTGTNNPALRLRVVNISDLVRVGGDGAQVEFGSDATVRIVAHDARPGKCP